MTLSIAAYRQAGDLIEDIDVDDDAEIQIQKLATRTLSLSFPGAALQPSGAGVVNSNSNIYGGVILPDANTGILYGSFMLPDEWSSGNIVVRMWWNSGSTVGNIKLTVDVKSTTKDGTLTSEETQSVVDAAKGTATRINVATVTLAAADFTAGDVVGFSITRDPADAADTLGGNIRIMAVTFEYTGRG